MRSIKNRRGAMELTMGTMVTMVLLVAVLILGGFLINRIFSGATEAVDSINQEVSNEINKLFSDDTSKKVVIFPSSRKLDLEKGSQGTGFAFSIRNVDTISDTFSYSIEAAETSCPNELTVQQASNFIALGKSGNVDIPAGSIMQDPRLVTFSVPTSAPPCSISYNVNVNRGGQIYSPSLDVIVNILAN